MIAQLFNLFREVRCTSCGRLLCRITKTKEIQVKCSKCGTVNTTPI